MGFGLTCRGLPGGVCTSPAVVGNVGTVGFVGTGSDCFSPAVEPHRTIF